MIGMTPYDLFVQGECDVYEYARLEKEAALKRAQARGEVATEAQIASAKIAIEDDRLARKPAGKRSTQRTGIAVGRKAKWEK